VNHNQLSITFLSLCIVIGAIVFSEYTPAIPFESGSLRETSKVGLTRIIGQATTEEGEGEPEGCNCKAFDCEESAVGKICCWTYTDEATGEGVCSGCDRSSFVTEASWGTRKECYNGKNPDSMFFGCCHNKCSELGCPTTCPQTTWPRKHTCSDKLHKEHCIHECYKP